MPIDFIFDESINNLQSEYAYTIPIPSTNQIIFLQYTISPLVVKYCLNSMSRLRYKECVISF